MRSRRNSASTTLLCDSAFSPSGHACKSPTSYPNGAAIRSAKSQVSEVEEWLERLKLAPSSRAKLLRLPALSVGALLRKHGVRQSRRKLLQAVMLDESGEGFGAGQPQFTCVCIQDSSSEMRNFHILRCPYPTGYPGSFPLRARSRSVLRGIARKDAARCASTYGSNTADAIARLCMVYPPARISKENFPPFPTVEPRAQFAASLMLFQCVSDTSRRETWLQVDLLVELHCQRGSSILPIWSDRHLSAGTVGVDSFETTRYLNGTRSDNTSRIISRKVPCIVQMHCLDWRRVCPVLLP